LKESDLDGRTAMVFDYCIGQILQKL
jgi:hypothetical protein